MAHAFGVATSTQLEVLNKIGSSQLTNDDVSSIQEVLVDTGSVAHVESLIAQHYDEAVAAINMSNIPTDARTALVDLAVSVTQRSV